MLRGDTPEGLKSVCDRADTAPMRVLLIGVAALALAGPAAAAPRLGLYDLSADLAGASRNAFGDMQVRPHAVLAQKAPWATLVRCGPDCRLGSGWLALAAAAPRLGGGDIAKARPLRRRIGWSVELTLTRRGRAAWKRLTAQAALHVRRRGVPPVYAVVANRTIVALPYANGIRVRGRVLELPGFTAAGAREAAGF
jgi:hypothetical protein